MAPINEFAKFTANNISKIGTDKEFQSSSSRWLDDSLRLNYSYNFTWMGRPVIQYPQDLMALQEIIWRTKPEVIVETGIAHGGSLIFHASMLELLGEGGKVVGIDIDIRPHNKSEIISHPLGHRIQLIEGSSTSPSVISEVKESIKGAKRVMVILDSLHTHEHVRQELDLYSPLVKAGQYLVVLDTIIEFMEPERCGDRPWHKGNNPHTAVKDFLCVSDRFEIDFDFNNKLALTVAPDGYLKCLKD